MFLVVIYGVILYIVSSFDFMVLKYYDFLKSINYDGFKVVRKLID